MSAPLVDPLEAAIVVGAIKALRNRANVQRQLANEGTFAAGDKHPGVLIRSPESALATRIANDLDAIADEIGGAL